MKQTVIGFIIAAMLSSCNLFYHKSDKNSSDIAGIIPFQEKDGGTYAMEARYSNWPNPDTLIIYIDGARYKVSASGNVMASDGTVKYKLGNEYPIEQLYFFQKARDLFLFYTDVDVQGAGSFVKRLSLDSGKIIWETEVEGFSFSKPLIRGQFAYFGTIGFIGKMKLKNGSFDWKYSQLGQKGRFNHFRDIDFPDDKHIRFVAPHPFTMMSDTVIVSDITGEITLMN
ncbi:MAG: hypothetical protein MJZ15_03245 [Bacteroidales bacterium]|nr:hypothetical protein [Bacteroidales bacterium]